MKYLEDATGVTFSWKGVKEIEVPDDANQIKKIMKISDSAEAAKAGKLIKKGIAPELHKMEADLTPQEIKNKTYRLNIILP